MVCIVLTITGKSFKNAEQMDKEKEEETAELLMLMEEKVWQLNNDGINSSSGNRMPRGLSRRSYPLRHVISRREVRTLVEGFRENAGKLANLTNGIEILMKTGKEMDTRHIDMLEKLETNITKRQEIVSDVLENLQKMNSLVKQRQENTEALIVPMFVMLVDIVFSTSSRIDKHHDEVLKVSEYFRQTLIAQSDRDAFYNYTLPVFEYYTRSRVSTSCVGLRAAGFIESGIYSIILLNAASKSFNVSCDQETDGGGWLVIQHREDGSEDFYRNWSDYQNGFGHINKEFWLGNELLHLLTRTQQELRVEIMDFDGNAVHAKYSSFAVGSASENYKLTVSGYSGTGGDGLSNNNGMGFSTYERDNDNWPNSCAQQYKGGWWYNSCVGSNLNGLYLGYSENNPASASWYHWKNSYESLKITEMKIRPSN